MIIKIAGANGYLGSNVADELKKYGHTVFNIKRELLYGSTNKLQKELTGADVVYFLAGAPILQRWTEKNKKVIYDSRVVTVCNIVTAMNEITPADRPKQVVSASAAGIYKTGETHDESSTDFDDSFVGKVVKDWEAAWEKLPDDVNLSIFRIGLVLGKEAETIKKLLIPFKLGLGGKVGSGDQPFPFVHIKDVRSAFSWALENKKYGVFNLAAPVSVTNKEFTKALAAGLKRPAFFTVPEFALKMIFGKAAVLLTESPAVLPARLEKSGFSFSFPTIESAVEEIINKKPSAS